MHHLAAVAASYLKMGWGIDSKYWWFDFTTKQAKATYSALEFLSGVSRHKLVTYEEIALNPLTMFKKLFKFAEIDWSNEVEAFIVSTMTEKGVKNPYSHYRDTKQMVSTLKNSLTAGQLDQVNKAYFEYDLAW